MATASHRKRSPRSSAHNDSHLSVCEKRVKRRQLCGAAQSRVKGLEVLHRSMVLPGASSSFTVGQCVSSAVLDLPSASTGKIASSLKALRNTRILESLSVEILAKTCKVT
ncbi:hypothetical protein WMY93_010626 [Mugilogobius chulae]|uniref:Uncharacterized protein n=1 Tax=Mugilogobius chulae TaxID=88201 RepID=A0AAW0P7W6_9GOBI